jgi:acyl-CoA thioesterase-2
LAFLVNTLCIHMNLSELLGLSTHGQDIFIGVGALYPWGGLYGGHIVAQSLRACASTVDSALQVHSLRAYFLRRGNATENVRYEVERIRDGNSFSTRRVVARQDGGVILHLECSFHRSEASVDRETITMPSNIPGPNELQSDSWSPIFERRRIPENVLRAEPGAGAGRATAWVKTLGSIDADQVTQQCALAYVSDDFPGDAVVRARAIDDEPDVVQPESFFHASLDHSMWFHRPIRADEWHLCDFVCHSFVGGRGLTIGHIFGSDGTHAATVAQEFLLRDSRDR